MDQTKREFPEFLGPYRVCGTPFNSGSYGKLAIGKHFSSGEMVCVKCIPDGAWDDNERVCLGSLRHRNVIGLKGYYLVDGRHYLVTEYAQGGDLFDFLEGKERVPEAEVRMLGVQLVEALQYIHESGIVHRDLKLENIFLDSARKRVFIGDWGFSCFFSMHRRLQESCGTLYYMAPELIAHQSYTGPEADVWSLGVVLYYLAVGSLPFDNDDTSTTKKLILRCQPFIPSYLSPQLRHLLIGMLRPAATRFSLRQVAAHPWFQLQHPPCLQHAAAHFQSSHQFAQLPKLSSIAAAVLQSVGKSASSSSSASYRHASSSSMSRSSPSAKRRISKNSQSRHNKRQRRVYRCRRCGLPKRGHVCSAATAGSSSTATSPFVTASLMSTLHMNAAASKELLSY